MHHMSGRKVFGGGLAVLACPCHFPFYFALLIWAGVGSAAALGWLLPALTIGFLGGLAILLWPQTVDRASVVQLETA